jgi:acyl carrier protein
MTELTDDMRAKVKDIVCDILELEPDAVSDTSSFTDDLGADSMQTIEVLASLELNFGVVIAQSELDRMVSLAGVLDVLADRLAAAAGGSG